MRQGGFKPKGHNSGTYWVRANANGGGKKTKKSITSDEDFGDVVENITSDKTTIIAKNTGRIIGLILAAFLIYIGVTYSP